MKQIVTLKPREYITMREAEEKIRSARNSNDYIEIKFGRKREFIKIAFCKDQTYCIGYNFINMEFMAKTNIMLKQFPKVVTNKLAFWIVHWTTRLNR